MQVHANKEYAAGNLSNVRRCCLAMPLGADILRWVLACRAIENKTKVYNVFYQLHIFYLHSQPSSDSSWTKAVSLQTTVPVNNSLLTGTLKKIKFQKFPPPPQSPP